MGRIEQHLPRGADTFGTTYALSGLFQGERGPRVPETNREGGQCVSVSLSFITRLLALPESCEVFVSFGFALVVGVLAAM